MITYGIILVVVGIIVWAVGRAFAPRPPARILAIAGEAIGAIGVVLLLVGLVVLLLRGFDGGVDLDTPRAMLGV